jgi:hypothetical protein
MRFTHKNYTDRDLVYRDINILAKTILIGTLSTGTSIYMLRLY